MPTAARTRRPVPSPAAAAPGSVPVAAAGGPLGRRGRRMGQRQRVVGRGHGGGRRGSLVQPGQHRLRKLRPSWKPRLALSQLIML